MSGSKDEQGVPPYAAMPAAFEDDASRAISAATAQIDLALREARGPVETLGHTLEHIAGHVTDLRKRIHVHSQHCASEQAILDMELGVEAVWEELANAIQSMQFYDRLFQHLSHVQDYLAGGADLLAEASRDDAPGWEALRERLFSRLLSDAQRQVLDIALPRGERDMERRGAARATHAVPGEIELF